MSEKKVSQFGAIIDLCKAWAGEGATRKQIAEALGLKKSIHVTNLIRVLVSEKYITEVLDDRQYPARYRYFLVQE